MWVLFSLLAGSFYTGSELVKRYVLKQQYDAWAFSFFFSAVGAAVSLPFMALNPKAPVTSSWLWLTMLCVGGMIVLHNLLNFKSSNYVPASVSGTITKFRLGWIFILGILFSGEVVTYPKVLAVILSVAAGIVILKRFKMPHSLKGVLLSFAATFVYAIIITVVKHLLTTFSPQAITFFIFFIPAILNYILMPQAWAKITYIFQKSGKYVILASIFGGFANLTINQALSLGEASRVSVMVESFLVVTLIGEHIIFKETDHLVTKIIAVVLAVASAFLVQL